LLFEIKPSFCFVLLSLALKNTRSLFPPFPLQHLQSIASNQSLGGRIEENWCKRVLPKARLFSFNLLRSRPLDRLVADKRRRRRRRKTRKRTHRIPVLCAIHSSFVSTSCERSAFVSTCAGAELPEPASRTPAAALVRIRRPLPLLLLLLLVARLQLPLPLPLPLPPPMPLLLAVLPLLCLASVGPRRDWREGLDEVPVGGGEHDERVIVADDGPIIITFVVPLLSRAAIWMDPRHPIDEAC
jgi:hypothetical protein